MQLLRRTSVSHLQGTTSTRTTVATGAATEAGTPIVVDVGAGEGVAAAAVTTPPHQDTRQARVLLLLQQPHMPMQHPLLLPGKVVRAVRSQSSHYIGYAEYF